MRRILQTGSITVAATLAVAGLALPSTGPAWAGGQADLAVQMLAEEDCAVAFYSGVVERNVDGRTVLFVHVVCEDGRAYDARRFEGTQKPFTISPCDIDVC